jgi:hypothetical protein
VKLCFLFLAAFSLTFGQTQVDLRSQSRNVDFSGAPVVKPVTVGTVLPATCTAGAMFFKSDAAPGANLYGCVSANTWTAESGSSGTFTDLRSTATSTAYSIEPGRARFTVNGLPVVMTLGPATITKSTGNDTGVFWIYADYNAGAPVLRCLAGPGINISNYVVSNNFVGATCASGSGFPALSIPLATLDISAGLMQPPVDYRSMFARDPLFAGTGLTLAGNVLSVTGAAGNVMSFAGAAGNVLPAPGAAGSGGVERVSYNSLPACTLERLNTEFLFTDGVGFTTHCDGVSHAYFYKDQPITLPGVVSNFTKVNARAGNDVTDNQGALYVHAEAAMGNGLVTALKGLSGATDIRAAVVFSSGGGDFNTCGLLVADGSAITNKTTLFGKRSQSGTPMMGIVNYATNATGVVGTQRAFSDSGSAIWLRLLVAGETHKFYVSADGGRSWEQVASQSAYETPTHYGIGCDASGTATSTGMLVVSLSAQ